MLTIENVTKNFGNKVAVDNLSLKINKGELFAFLGPNAAGKTTTLKLITGLLKSTRGRIKIGDYDINKQGLLAKKLIGYIPDTPFLYEKLTISEFLNFCGKIYGVENLTNKMQELLQLFGIEEEKDSLIEDVSHGIRQRIVFCATLLHNPPLILIDEPMVGLDPLSVNIVKRILKEKVKQGNTIFMCTHSLPIAEELADRIGIIHQGKLLAIGTFKELKKLANVSGNLEEVFLKLTTETIEG